MIRLDTFQRKLQAVLSGAVTTSEPTAIVCYTDIENENQKKFFVEAQTSTLNGATAVDILFAPDKAMVREVDSIHIRNNDTDEITLTVRINDNAVISKLVEVTLQAGETLVYTDSEGWKVLTEHGNTASVFNYIDLAEGPYPDAERRLKWNNTDGTLDVGLRGGNVTMQVGLEQVMLVKSSTNSGIDNGKCYYFVGSDGANKTVAKAIASSGTQADNVLGIATESSTGGNKAFLTTFGLVRNIDTDHLTEGAQVYLSAATAGELVATRPVAPDHAVQVGYCIRKSATVGAIFVELNKGSHLEYLHDVKLTTLTDKQYIRYNNSLGYWENTSSGEFSDLYVSGNVGIGTSSPGQRLHLKYATGAAGGIRLEQNGWDYYTRFGSVGSVGDEQYWSLNFAPATNTVDESTMRSTYILQNSSSGFVSIGTSFLTNAVPTERLRIDSSGNVGIGTSSPGSKLDVLNNRAETPYAQGWSVWNNATFEFATVLGGDATNGCFFGPFQNVPLRFITNNTERLRIDSSGNVIVNTAAIATTATDGFLYVPTCAGPPTGTPTTYTGRAPIVVDSTNNKLYFYSGGQWRDAGP